LKEVKKRRFSILSLSLSLPPTQTHIIFISLEKKHKNIIKGGKKKGKAEGTSLLVSFSFDLFFF